MYFHFRPDDDWRIGIRRRMFMISRGKSAIQLRQRFEPVLVSKRMYTTIIILKVVLKTLATDGTDTLRYYRKAMYGYRCATECIAELTLYLLSLTQTGKFYQKAAVLEQGFWTLQLVVCITSSYLLFLMVVRSFTTWEFGRYYRKFDRLEITVLKANVLW